MSVRVDPVAQSSVAGQLDEGMSQCLFGAHALSDKFDDHLGNVI